MWLTLTRKWKIPTVPEATKKAIEDAEAYKEAALADYENCLKKAQQNMENALTSVEGLSGDLPRQHLKDALKKVRDAIRSSWQFHT